MSEDSDAMRQARETKAVAKELRSTVLAAARAGEEYKKAAPTRKLSMELATIGCMLMDAQNESYDTPESAIEFAKMAKTMLEGTLEAIIQNAAAAASLMTVGVFEATQGDGTVLKFGPQEREQASKPNLRVVH